MKTRLPAIILASALIAAPTLQAAPYSARMYATPDRQPDFADVEYARPGGTPLRLDIYLPADRAKPSPLVILIHGGGWRIGSKEQFRHMAERLASAGFAAATIDYRLTDIAPFPAQLHDCKSAVRWARAQAVHYGWDPGKIAVLGDSSGAQLAMMVGLTGGQVDKQIGSTLINLAGRSDDGPGLGSRVQAVVDFFGYADLRPFSDGRVPEPKSIPLFLGGPAATRGDIAAIASPIVHVAGGAPPMFIGQGRADEGMYRQSRSVASDRGAPRGQ